MSLTSPSVLFINTTLKSSPELSNTEALWHIVRPLYQEQGCTIEQIRVADLNLGSGNGADGGTDARSGDDFLALFQRMQDADIVIVGTPVTYGNRSSQCQALMARSHPICQQFVDPATGQSPLYNTVVGLVLVGDNLATCSAQLAYEFSQLGCITPPNHTMGWSPNLDHQNEFMEAKGQYSKTVNRDARLLVEHSVTLAKALAQMPLSANVHEASRAGSAIATTRPPKLTTRPFTTTATLLTPKAISTPEHPVPNGIDYRHITRRIWTVMQEGIRRGFTLTVMNLEDRIFRAERDGKGFTYKIYPGHFSFRCQYEDYDREQAKSHKLGLMRQDGLAVPTSYGLFKRAADIPLNTLTFPLVAKPDSGSLSQNVFANLQDADQVLQAANVIEASGATIKLESHLVGRDYRVLIINHQYAGCVERRPANVVGDGVHTIRDLFHLRNQEEGRGDRHESHSTLHQLVFDHTSRRLLTQAGYTLETVLPKGKLFYIQEKIIASLGADYVDHTDQLHPSIIEGCIEFSRRFSTLTVGFDLITSDVSRPLAETGGGFNEYNFLPYVDLHEYANIGQTRSVCRLIWDYIEDHAEELITSEFSVF